MEINITQWALDSYLELKRVNAFTDDEYKKIIRPDVKLLCVYPNDTKFQQGKFWSLANDRNGVIIPDGYKMKWHQIGNGKIQLRLVVGMIGGEIYLCNAYVKRDDKVDRRELAKFKGHLQLIRQGQYTIRGKLT